MIAAHLQLIAQVAGHGPVRLLAFNPFDGVTPDPTIFGVAFNSWWKKALGGLWGLAMAYCGFKLFPAMASLHQNKQAGMDAGVATATKDVRLWGASTAGTVAAGILFGALLLAFQ